LRSELDGGLWLQSKVDEVAEPVLTLLSDMLVLVTINVLTLLLVGLDNCCSCNFKLVGGEVVSKERLILGRLGADEGALGLLLDR